MATFDFWFSIGSTYTYLTVHRLAGIENETGLEAAWRPFSVRAIMQEMNNVPFAGKPAKEKYMWRDFQRRAGRIGIDIELPIAYPLEHFDRANRVAILAAREGWCEDYVRAAYRYWMQQGLPAGGEENLGKSLADAGQSVQRVMDLAGSAEVEQEYLAATDAARALGIFGSPSFVVDGRELFWGDDRLEDAVEFWQAMAAS